MHQIELKGSPREMGQIHGESFRDKILELYEIRRELIQVYIPHWQQKDFDEACRQQFNVLKKHHALYEEFCGLVEASNLKTEQLVLLNNYTDMRDYHEPLGACSLYAYRNREQIFSGQTWDMHASAEPYTLLMKVGEENPHYVLSLMGCLGMAGVNSENVSVMINNLHCHETSMGLMWPALVRAMLKQKSAHEAFQFFQKNLPCSGHNYLINDDQESINVECTGKRYELTFRSHEGITWHTNHYVSKLAETEKERINSTSRQRYEELEGYFSEHGDDLDFETANRDIFAAEKVCSVAIDKPDDPHGAMTCGGLCLNIQTRKGFAFSGNLVDGDVLEIDW